ncbi:uncharacterized protein LOC100183744 [Ciona intestinalis]
MKVVEILLLILSSLLIVTAQYEGENFDNSSIEDDYDDYISDVTTTPIEEIAATPLSVITQPVAETGSQATTSKWATSEGSNQSHSVRRESTASQNASTSHSTHSLLHDLATEAVATTQGNTRDSDVIATTSRSAYVIATRQVYVTNKTTTSAPEVILTLSPARVAATTSQDASYPVEENTTSADAKQQTTTQRDVTQRTEATDVTSGPLDTPSAVPPDYGPGEGVGGPPLIVYGGDGIGSTSIRHTNTHISTAYTPDSTTSGDIMYVINVPLAVILAAHWRWFLLGAVAIVLLVLIPGMIIQISCHKFYLSYRREKHGDVEKNTEMATNLDQHPPTTVSVIHSEDNSMSEPSPTAPSFDPPPIPTQPEHDVINPPEPPLYNPDPYPSDQHRVMTCTEPEQRQDLYATIHNKQNIENGIQPQQKRDYEVCVIPAPVVRSVVPQTPQTTKQAIGNEAIIQSNRTQLDPIVTPRVKNSIKPTRPTRPKEYKIQQSKRRESKVREPKEKRRGLKTQDANRRRRENERRPGKKDPPVSDARELAERRKELKRKEELLRQIIAGVTEAEMLQRKLDRTRRWAKEQRRGRSDGSKEPKSQTRRPGKSERTRSDDGAAELERKIPRPHYNTDRVRKKRS